MDPLLALAATIALVVVVVLVHYETLLHASRLAERMTIPPRRRILVLIGAAFLAHLVEIALFAGGYWLMHLHPGLGAIGGELEGGPLDFVYFSLTMYTTLGVGDVAPNGLMRLPAGVESLVGLVLITWTASFSYLAMERFWGDH
jgi:Ion channel